MVVPHTRQLQSGASAQLLTLDGGDLVWCAGADTHLALGPRFQASAGLGSARLAEGGGLPIKVLTFLWDPKAPINHHLSSFPASSSLMVRERGHAPRAGPSLPGSCRPGLCSPG